MVTKRGKPWSGTLIFLDQYGNRHRVKNCVFKSMGGGGHPQPKKDPEEFPYQIVDRVEKEVVSVLKSELSRYAVCGRTCGGLGSVHIAYGGTLLIGVGGDS
jgi:hypothetical protein